MYHYTSTPMSAEEINESKRVAKLAGLDFEYSEPSPGRFCFWVANSYGGAASARETNDVIAAIENAGIELPKFA